jgi:DNA-binding NarL/FixJ family response regulator
MQPETTNDDISLKLTPRQGQVLKLICHRGLSNKAIGNILKISESTVKIHTSAILRQYGVKNRTQLVLAYSNNLRA